MEMNILKELKINEDRGLFIYHLARHECSKYSTVGKILLNTKEHKLTKEEEYFFLYIVGYIQGKVRGLVDGSTN